MSKDGGPAFPVTFDHGECLSEQEGMSLRDYFAAKAMQASTPFISIGVPDYEVQRHAEHFYRVADAMLKARGA